MKYCNSTLGRHSTKNCPDLLFYLAHIDFPKNLLAKRSHGTSRRSISILLKDANDTRMEHMQHIFVQPLFHMSCISKFSLITPPLTLHDRLRVLAFRHLKRPTGIGGRIRLTAEVLDHSFTSAVTDRGHVERTTLFLTYLLTLGI